VVEVNQPNELVHSVGGSKTLCMAKISYSHSFRVEEVDKKGFARVSDGEPAYD
jgi:hypothetical protein